MVVSSRSPLRACAIHWRRSGRQPSPPTLERLQALATEHAPIDWTGELFFALGWLVLVLSLGAISLLNYLIRHGSAVNVASLFYLTPPVTALIAWVLFDETLTLIGCEGLVIAVIGVALVRKA